MHAVLQTLFPKQCMLFIFHITTHTHTHTYIYICIYVYIYIYKVLRYESHSTVGVLFFILVTRLMMAVLAETCCQYCDKEINSCVYTGLLHF